MWVLFIYCFHKIVLFASFQHQKKKNDQGLSPPILIIMPPTHPYNNNRLFMAPHLVRAQSTYRHEDTLISSHTHTHTFSLSLTHKHTHTRTTNTIITHTHTHTHKGKRKRGLGLLTDWHNLSAMLHKWLACRHSGWCLSSTCYCTRTSTAPTTWKLVTAFRRFSTATQRWCARLPWMVPAADGCRSFFAPLWRLLAVKKVKQCLIRILLFHNCTRRLAWTCTWTSAGSFHSTDSGRQTASFCGWLGCWSGCWLSKSRGVRKAGWDTGWRWKGLWAREGWLGRLSRWCQRRECHRFSAGCLFLDVESICCWLVEFVEQVLSFSCDRW